MRFIFFADASPEIGSGHVMRSCAIAEEAISQGIECVFIGSIKDLNWLTNFVNRLGFHTQTTWLNFTPDPENDVLVIDSYQIAPSDPYIKPSNWKFVVSVCDQSTPNYSAGLAIHPGLHKLSNQNNAKVQIAGSLFIPFRKSIRRARKSRSLDMDKIVVFGGGADTHEFCHAIALQLLTIPGFKNAVFFSHTYADLDILDPRFSTYEIGLDLDRELESADLVFTTASTSSLEVIARGIPLGIVSAVENQVSLYSDLTSLGAAASIGSWQPSSGWILNSSEIFRVIQDSTYRRNILTNGSDLIDLDGSSRIIDEILRAAGNGVSI